MMSEGLFILIKLILDKILNRKITLILGLFSVIFSACATTHWQWKDHGAKEPFGKAQAECYEKSITDRQVQACLANRGWYWEQSE